MSKPVPWTVQRENLSFDKKHRRWLRRIQQVIHKGGSKNIKLLPKTRRGISEYQTVIILKNGRKIGEAGFYRKPGKKNWTMDLIEG